MCFSAEASFAASGVLAASSVAIARTPKERASIPLALFPAIFATHQFIEGVIWLNQEGILPDAHKPAAVYAYALIAYVLWPILVPFSAYLIETKRRRRRLILVCQAIGLGVGLALLLSFFRTPPSVVANCCSLSYRVDAPEPLIIPYLVAVCVPFLASSRRNLVLFGLCIAVSFVAAAVATSVETLPSVWCFFAALLSGGLYLYFRTAAQTSRQQLGANRTSGAMAG
jgi:hypothetical protein